METVVQQTPSNVVDRMEPTVRDHTAKMVDREATVVRVERVGLLEVEDEVGQVDEDAKDSVDHHDRKSHILLPFLAHFGGCAGLVGADVVKIFVHRGKTERSEQNRGVQRCTRT